MEISNEYLAEVSNKVATLREEVRTQAARITALEQALSECISVLAYIGNGVSAHSMADQYAKIHSDKLSKEELNAGYNRVKTRYDDELAAMLRSYK